MKQKTKKPDPKDKVIRPIAMSEEYWANSQLSIVRYYGRIQMNGEVYTIVNKEGKTVFELSATCEGDKCIPPGEPCDLVANPFIHIYRELGRDNFLRMLRENNELTVNKAKEWVKRNKSEHKTTSL